jgi:phage gpG-like protein
VTTQVFSLLGFVAHLETIKRDMHALGPAIVAKACEMVCNEAKRVLGTHDYGWPELQPETIARKIRGDTPLLETGKLRESIQWNAEGNFGFIGSDSPVAVWHELGTSRIPPRPFLAGAAMHMEDKIHKMAARAALAVIAGRGLHSTELHELLHVLHLLKDVAHKVKEDLVDPLLEDKGERDR